MTFDKQKKQILSRLDKSKKGSVDMPIKKLVERINSFEDYFTSSSCSGRILILEILKQGRKGINWLFVKHTKATFNEIKKALAKISVKEVWFKYEPMIIHICCKNIDAAKRMLRICRQAGLKRAGIITIGKKIMIEAFGTERLDTIIAENGNILINDDYLKILVREANKKQVKNIERIGELYNKIKELE